MGTRRGAGEGSIRQRATGIWEARLDTGQVTPDAKRIVKSVYAPTRAEVQRKLAALKRQIDEGTATSDRQTVATYLTGWLAAKQGTIRPRTHERYATTLRLHVMPALGRRVLAELRPSDVQALYQRLSTQRSPTQARQVHAILHIALAHAVRRQLVTRNVSDLVDLPRAAVTEHHVPTVADVRQLLSATTGDRLYPLWMLAVHTGARRGELLGLQWSDLDWAAGTLSIRRGLASTAKGAPVFDETKSRRSRRTLTVPTTVLECLRAHQAAIDVERAKVGTYYQEYGLMFPTSIGTAPSARNVLRSFKAALAAAGLPDATRFHDLRHAAATAMLAAGVPLKVASERLGHSAVAITADLYTHRVASLEADAAERLAVLFAPEEGDDG